MKRFLVLIACAIMCMAASAQETQTNQQSKVLRTVPQLYAFSVGMSPTDSTVYMSDVLILNNAQLVKSNGFLVGRQDYSSQFRNYLAELDMPNRTCATMYKENYRNASKEYDKMKADFEKRGFKVRVIDQTEFRYIVIRND
ncbi:MAG: hypothetical protein IJ183_05455 [Prevotella sp.]|nr:hypothetical protein [Prevotella sp.]MBQ9237342.1 hypothetical protein [Prevotella sp.]MBR1839540.1 hypothetical protein [Prevotella sp.]